MRVWGEPPDAEVLSSEAEAWRLSLHVGLVLLVLASAQVLRGVPI